MLRKARTNLEVSFPSNHCRTWAVASPQMACTQFSASRGVEGPAERSMPLETHRDPLSLALCVPRAQRPPGKACPGVALHTAIHTFLPGEGPAGPAHRMNLRQGSVQNPPAKEQPAGYPAMPEGWSGFYPSCCQGLGWRGAYSAQCQTFSGFGLLWWSHAFHLPLFDPAAAPAAGLGFACPVL